MGTFRARWFILSAALLAVSLGARTAAAGEGDWANDPKWLLFVTQDEKSLEETIAKYLILRDGVHADMRFLKSDPDDMILSYTLQPDKAPKIECIVDTFVSNRSDDGKVRERCITVHAWFKRPESAQGPQAARRIETINNKWVLTNWMPQRVFIDGDGDISLKSYINIPETSIPVHCEMVRDLILRSNNAWEEYYGELVKDDLVPAYSKPEE